jgi:hypothetical protein
LWTKARKTTRRPSSWDGETETQPITYFSW